MARTLQVEDADTGKSVAVKAKDGNLMCVMEALQVTAETINLQTDQLEELLGDIRDTYGIKKITDALPSGENHIGSIGDTAQIQPTLAVDTGAYSAGDCVGGKLTLTDALRVVDGRGLIQSLFVLDASNTKPYLELIIFNADPTNATLVDQSPVVFGSDTAKIIRRIPVYQNDYTSVGGVAIADISPGGRVVKGADGTKNLYACIVATGSHDFVASTDLILRFGMLRD